MATTMTMMRFSGTALGVPFTNREAESPSDLYRQLFPGDEEGMRCWVRMSTNGSFFWMEMPLDKPILFERVRDLLGDDILAIFRSKSSSSPNSSPDKTLVKGDKSEEAVATTDDVSAVLAKSSLDEFIFEISAESHAQDVKDTLNDTDPFTAKKVGDVTDLLYLHFPVPGSVDAETLGVSQEGFEEFVVNQFEKGVNICELQLKRVKCKRCERDFLVSPVVWIRSILQRSHMLRTLYFKVNSSTLARDYQLKQMKEELPSLWARVTYWIADFYSFSQAEDRRLSMPVDDGIPPFLSPFYFDKSEAQFLGQLTLPSTQLLGDALRDMLEDKAGNGATEICASHDLAPFLEKAFDMKHNFHKHEKFKKSKSNWIRQREKETKKIQTL